LNETKQEGTMSLNVKSTFSEAPANRTAELRDFFESLHLPDSRLDPDTLVSITDALAARPELFEDLLVDDEVNRWWLQLFLTDNYEVRLLTWEREQSSDWHDHGGSSGAWTVTAGSLYETYRAEDHFSVRDRHYVAGDNGSFGPEHVHDVIYEAGKPAVSIHAYSPPLSGLTVYDRTRFGFVARDFVLEENRAAQRS
jgi:quercetin dioxygenase-like cupin family protein